MFISIPKEFFVPVLFNNDFKFNSENNNMEYDYERKSTEYNKVLSNNISRDYLSDTINLNKDEELRQDEGFTTNYFENIKDKEFEEQIIKYIYGFMRFIKELKAATNLPFIVKGIMTVEDALLAVEAGVDAIVVSNHGGRVLDCTPGAAEVLPDIAEAVKDKLTVLVDGGVRSGVDVLKLIGLGADGVLIGRPFVTASFGGGKEGVELYVNKVIGELEATMRLTGCQTVKEIDGKVIFR